MALSNTTHHCRLCQFPHMGGNTFSKICVQNVQFNTNQLKAPVNPPLLSWFFEFDTRLKRWNKVFYNLSGCYQTVESKFTQLATFSCKGKTTPLFFTPEIHHANLSWEVFSGSRQLPLIVKNEQGSRVRPFPQPACKQAWKNTGEKKLLCAVKGLLGRNKLYVFSPTHRCASYSYRAAVTPVASPLWAPGSLW